MYYNRNLITAEQHPVTPLDASGVFDLQAQAFAKAEEDWPYFSDFLFAFRVETGVAQTVKLARQALGSVTYTVDWGDGSSSQNVTDLSASHTYAPGIYVAKVTISSGGPFVPHFNGDFPVTGFVASGSYSSANCSTLQSAFSDLARMTFFDVPFSAYANVSGFQNAWFFCSKLESFPTIDVSSGTNFQSAWQRCMSLTSFPELSFNSATSLKSAWNFCYNLETFPSITNTSNVTNFDSAWKECLRLSTFPSIDTSAGTNFVGCWANCQSLSSFPTIDTSSGTNFNQAWQTMFALTAFPSLDFSSATSFVGCWNGNKLMTTFPANSFDSTGTLASNAFNNAFVSCALTAQSIENILTSLDTNGAQNITLTISGGTNAGASTWSSAAITAYNNLVTKGWSISRHS